MAGQSVSGLAGKSVIVTGSGRGIGEANAKLFAAAGALVAVNARTEEQVQRVVDDIKRSGGTAHGIVDDVGDPEGVKTLVGGRRAGSGPWMCWCITPGYFLSSPSRRWKTATGITCWT